MTFEYEARDALGHTMQGMVEAGSAEEATQQLNRDGLSVLSIEQAGEVGTLLTRGVTKKEIVYTTNQLAVMVETGITLSTAIESIIEQEKNPTLKRVLKDLKSGVESGEEFSTALARHPKLFNQTYISLIKASEATGTLGEMLDRVATYLRKEVEARSKIRAAMAYPAVMMVVAVGVTIFLLTYVLPKFAPLFNSKKIKLPTSTVFMMTASECLIGYWYLWLLAAILLVLGFIFGRRTEPGRKAWDWFKINAPLVGSLNRKTIISRSIRTLGAMVQSGVPMLESIQLTADVAGNYYYERLWLKVLDEVTSGKRICDALAGSSLFPSTLVQMISSGEETGKLDMVLQRVSSYYDQEVDAAIKTTTSMIEPIMITIMGVIVGGIAMSLLLPIFQLSRPG
ncbi:MAG: type II secretion system F family protein [Planctomycetes bacterium]|nr:type II secretion system F family protein [Planctomycetota bacterium]